MCVCVCVCVCVYPEDEVLEAGRSAVSFVAAAAAASAALRKLYSGLK